VTELEAAYLTEEVAAEARAKIVSGETFPVSYYNPSNYYTTREGGTSHLAAVDGNGMAVSLTTTVNLIWGSQVSECLSRHESLPQAACMPAAVGGS
jgi:gamma-glutamyltranspeptidase/glutathione hydrolase